MSRLRATALALIAASSVLAATAPTATAKVSVKDPKRETKALGNNGRLDLIRVTQGTSRGDLAFTATMRLQVRARKEDERPVGLINTRGNRRSRAEYLVFGGSVYRNPTKGDPQSIGPASLDSAGRTWTYRFDPDVIPGLGRFEWAISTRKRNASDIAPGDRYARSD